LAFDNKENKKNYDIVKAKLNNKLDDSKKNEENNNIDNVLQNSALMKKIIKMMNKQIIKINKKKVILFFLGYSPLIIKP